MREGRTYNADLEGACGVEAPVQVIRHQHQGGGSEEDEERDRKD
jgi:hypothetical protein